MTDFGYDVDRYKDIEGYIVTCYECGKEFESIRDDSAFCSSTCRSRNHRRKGKLERDLVKAEHLIESLIARMPSSGESNVFVKLNSISTRIDSALAYVEANLEDT